jgi:TRAP-type mannitol/chloroaromatic compound transport system substrate-binding protein
MKKTAYLAIFLPSICLMFVSLALAADLPITWKVQTPWSKELWFHRAAQFWAEDVSKMSGDRLKIDLLETVRGEMPGDVVGAVQKGVRDAGYTSPGSDSQKIPAATLFAGSPAFFDLLGYFTWMQAYGGKDLLQEIYGNSVKIFPAGMSWGKVGMWATKKVETMADLKGKKIRSASPFLEKIYAEEGASIVTTPAIVGAIFLIAGGNLDAVDGMTPILDFTFGLHKHTQYAYFPSVQMGAGYFAVCVNNEKWEALPADLKVIVMEACNSANAKSLTHWLLEDAKAIKLLKEQGKPAITKFSPQMQQEILNRLLAQYDAVSDPLFQKVWKSQKEFMKIYVPYMELQKVDAVVDLK